MSELPANHPLRGLKSTSISWDDGAVEIVALDGRVWRSHVRITSESHSLRRTKFNVPSSTVEFTLHDGTNFTAEIGTLYSSVDRPVVYLDQVHWVTLAQIRSGSPKLSEEERPAGERLLELARGGDIILPLSSAHLVETSKTGGRRRVDLALAMAELSRGWQMRSPLYVRAMELDQLFSRETNATGAETRSTVFTLDPDAVWSDPRAARGATGNDLPAELSGLVRRLSSLSALFEVLLDPDSDFSEEARASAERWASSIHELAVHMRGNPRARPHRRALSLVRFISDMGDDVPRATTRAGLTPEQFSEWLTKHAESEIARAPALSRVREIFHLRLVNADDPWEPNDLNDLLFLSCAVGYADVVVGEAKFSNYLTRSVSAVPKGAAVFRRLRDAQDTVEELLVTEA